MGKRREEREETNFPQPTSIMSAKVLHYTSSCPRRCNLIEILPARVRIIPNYVREGFTSYVIMPKKVLHYTSCAREGNALNVIMPAKVFFENLSFARKEVFP